MNEEDQLTVNVEDDNPGKRPVKKKPAAKKVPKKPGTAGKKAGKKTAAVPSPKVPSTGKKPVKKTLTKKAVPGKSGKPRKTAAPAKPSRTRTSRSKKPGKSVSGATLSRRTSSPKTPGKSKAAASTKKVEVANSGVPSKRTYTKHIPEGVDFKSLTPAKTYGIARVEQESKKNYGFYVRVGPPGSRSSLFFSDKKHGGPRKALQAATAKRDELFAALPDWYKVRASKKRKVAA